jgi:hypothetical protein
MPFVVRHDEIEGSNYPRRYYLWFFGLEFKLPYESSWEKEWRSQWLKGQLDTWQELWDSGQPVYSTDSVLE